jgi:4-cresol dehydrogenase (hydroxylating) flavoprotein subunit
VPYETLEALRKRFGWGFWKGDFALYGTPEIVQAQLQAVQRAFALVPGARVVSKFFAASPADALTARDIGPEEIPHAGMPTLAPLMMMSSRGDGCGHISFSPLIPPSGRDVYAWYLGAKAMTTTARFDFFADFHIYPRYVVAIELVVFADAERDRVHDLFRKLLVDGEARGYSEYRTHVAFMDEVAAHFSANNGALRRFVSSIKDIVDPNHILSPGKSGIWGNTA